MSECVADAKVRTLHVRVSQHYSVLLHDGKSRMAVGKLVMQMVQTDAGGKPYVARTGCAFRIQCIMRLVVYKEGEIRMTLKVVSLATGK